MIPVERKNFKLVFVSVCFFIFGVTAGSFCTMTYDKMQSEKEEKSKVTADQCREIFNNFVEEHNSKLQLVENFEENFKYYSEISEMTPDEYYEHVEEIYQKSNDSDIVSGKPTKRQILVQKSKTADGEYKEVYTEIEVEETITVYTCTEEENYPN